MKEREVFPRLVTLILVTTMAFGTITGSSALSSGATREDSGSGETVQMAFFYDPECPCSENAMYNIIPALIENYSYLNVKWYDVTKGDNKTKANDFFEAYNIPERERYDYPFLFVGDRYLSYENVDYESGAALIEEYRDTGAPLWPAWNVTWSTEIAFFYNSSAPFITSSGQTALMLIQSLDTTHIRHNFFDTFNSLTNSSLLRRFLMAYNSSKGIADAAVFIGNENHSLVDDEINYSALNEMLMIYAGRNTRLTDVDQPGDGNICVLIFYSPTCGKCYQALEFLWEMGLKYEQLKIIEFDTANRVNEKKKQSYFNEYNVPQKEWGMLGVFIGDRAFTNVSELKADFEEVINKYTNGSPCPELKPNKDDIYVLIFYSPTCGKCYQALEFLKEMSYKYEQLIIVEFDTSKRENEKKKQSYFNAYEVQKEKWGTLGVFIGDKAYYDVAELKADFEDEIKKYPYGSPYPPEPEPYDPKIDWPIIVIIGAGLIDGINPCAFVTIMLLVSYLVIRKREKKVILLTGISYTLGVFITYLLLGIGIYKWLSYIKGITTISGLMYPITGIIALLLAIYSLLDYYKIKKGKGEETTLKLPKSIKKLTNRIVRKHMKSRRLAGFAFITGAVISALEFMCTGQVYLPTIVYILGEPGFQSKAFFYLVLYNTMFILPLVGVFLAVYYGVTSEKLESIFMKRVGLIKILTALLFFILAIFMFLISGYLDFIST